jgi:Fe-S-cluster-containing dehydrogenase component
MKATAILYDSTICTGCNSCGYRCVQEFRYHDQAARGFFRNFTLIKDEGLFQKRCMHCLEPACVRNCPAEALTKTDYGPVLLDVDKCVGCGTCAGVCPFKVPQIDKVKMKMVKCSMCAHRLGEGKQPACTEVCPTGALQFGDYQDMAARSRKEAGARKLTLYGLQENGGTSLFILTKADPTALGYPKVPKRAVKVKTAGMETTLAVPAVAALAYAGFKKFSERRSRLEAEDKIE